MAVWRKTKMYGLTFILIIGFCFPPGGMEKGMAASKGGDNGFIITANEASGVLNLFGLRPGIILDVQVAFFSATIDGLVLSKEVNTGQGKMVLAIKSNKRVNLKNMVVQAASLNIGGLCWPHKFGDICLKNVTIDAKGLTSSSLNIPNLVVETTNDPNELAKIAQSKQKLAEQDDKEQLEKLILAMDEAKSGKLFQQKEAFEDLQNQLPELEKQADGFQTLLEEAEAQKKQLEDGMTSLEEVMDKADQLTKKPEFEEMLKGIDGKQKEITTNMEDFSVTLEQVDDLLQKVQKSLEKKREFVKARFELLEELELGEWSNSYKELAETEQKLDAVEEKVTAGFKRLEKLKENEKQLKERMKKINEKIEALKNKEIKEEKQEEQAGKDAEEETESDQKEKESDDEKQGEKDPEDSSQDDDMEAFTSSVNELFNQMDETNKNFSILGSKLEEDFIEPVKKALNNQLDDDEVTKLQQTLDESLKNKTMNNKLTKFVEIKEKMGDYKAQLAEQADELKQLKNHVEDDKQEELLEIENKIKESDNMLKEMQGRMEEIETHLDDLFKDSKQKQQELDENTNEPLLGILEDILKVEALLKEMKG